MKDFEDWSARTRHSRTLLGENTQDWEFRGAEDQQGPGRVKVAAGMREWQPWSSGEYGDENPIEMRRGGRAAHYLEIKEQAFLVPKVAQ